MWNISDNLPRICRYFLIKKLHRIFHLPDSKFFNTVWITSRSTTYNLNLTSLKSNQTPDPLSQTQLIIPNHLPIPPKSNSTPPKQLKQHAALDKIINYPWKRSKNKSEEARKKEREKDREDEGKSGVPFSPPRFVPSAFLNNWTRPWQRSWHSHLHTPGARSKPLR